LEQTGRVNKANPQKGDGRYPGRMEQEGKMKKSVRAWAVLTDGEFVLTTIYKHKQDAIAYAAWCRRNDGRLYKSEYRLLPVTITYDDGKKGD
jgi:hypothetical protein